MRSDHCHTTVFPYTTLFRSGVPSGADMRTPAQPNLSTGEALVLAGSFILIAAVTVGLAASEPAQTGTPRGNFTALFLSLDRKSTRLNSSHRCISYAVFCLKK